MGPPCGTFTRARERPIPRWLLEHGAPCPAPLRSDDRPEGFSPRHLSSTDRIKVHKGNVIAEFCAEVAQYCLKHGKSFSIENPTGSILWKLPCYINLLRQDGVQQVDFHACMWGSKRNKRTTFVTNMPALESLRKACDGRHEHAPWGLRWHKGWHFATEEECEYPKELCDATAKAVARAFNIPAPSALPARRKQKSKPGPRQAEERAAVGRQSRRHPRPGAIPDRQPPVSYTTQDPVQAKALRDHIGPLRDATRIAGFAFPAGSRIHTVVEQRPVGDDGSNQPKQWMCEYSLPWSEEEFFTKAAEA